MTITDLSPLRSDSERALLELLDSLRDLLASQGFARHEQAVQTFAALTRHLTPGAAAALAARSSSPEARLSAFQVVGRVLARCGDLRMRRRVSVMLAGYSSAAA